MAAIASFVFNPFEENTYLVYDESGDCLIIDPGCYTGKEQKELKQFIAEKNLKPVRLINTHGHTDHIFGNAFVAETWNLQPEIHRGDLILLQRAVEMGQMFGMEVESSPKPRIIPDHADTIQFGNSRLEILHTPGHSPGSISLYSKEDQWVIVGDALFMMSIGRTDLPGGNYQQLIDSIKTKLLPLGDETVVYSGHGPSTKIGFERTNNPFLN